MRLRPFAFAFLVTVGAAGLQTLTSCGSSDAAAPAPIVEKEGGGGSDAATVDAAFVSADHPAFPQLLNNGGPVLKSPKLVAITFANDPERARLDAFAETIGQTEKYWKAIADDYGVGLATGRGIHLAATAPATISDVQVRQLLVNGLSGATPPFGALDSEAIYTLYLPQGTAGVADAGDAGYTDADHAGKLCTASLGYHSAMQIGGKDVVYAIVPLCGASLYKPDGITTAIDALTAVSSHEWFEAVTDPFGRLGKSGYYGMDPLHSTWAVARGNDGSEENGDLCHLPSDHINLVLPAITYKVQRIWSNQEAKLGRHYCAPSNGALSFNAVPVLPETIPFTFDAKPRTAEGVHVAVGESKVVDLKLFSTEPTEEWTVEAIDALGFDAIQQGYSEVAGGYAMDGGAVIPPTLKFAFDKPKGKNGDVLKMTITVLRKDPRYGTAGAEPFYVVSKLGGEGRYYIGLVGN